MRTIIDVIKAVSGLIETEFGMPPTTKDIREGIPRPCFYVEPYRIHGEKAGDMRDDTFGIRVFYFSQRAQTGYLDLLEKQTVLRDLLDGPVPISEDFYLYPEDLDFERRREGMALVTSFTAEDVQLPEDTDTSEYMENLEINSREDE